MNLLLDTSEYLYLISGSSKLASERKDAIQEPSNLVFLSSVSAVEISIKVSIGKLALPELPETYIPRTRKLHQIAALPLTEPAALHLSGLPWHHRDPFDRLLIAQALAHDLTLVTSDPLIRKYKLNIM